MIFLTNKWIQIQKANGYHNLNRKKRRGAIISFCGGASVTQPSSFGIPFGMCTESERDWLHVHQSQVHGHVRQRYAQRRSGRRTGTAQREIRNRLSESLRALVHDRSVDGVRRQSSNQLSRFENMLGHSIPSEAFLRW